MQKTLFALTLLALFSTSALAINDTVYVETQVTLQTKAGEIFGTLTTPQNFNNIPVALIIAGSGPTDRDGNNPIGRNNSLKKLAHELSKNGIASLRYDKRGIAASKGSGKNELDLRFEDYVNDAKDWIQLLKKDKRFTKVIVIGHSEGSLIGMIAGIAADKFISIAGAGKSADKILKDQLSKQPKMVQDISFPIIDSLKNGLTVKNAPPMLSALFRPSVQPYLISWFKYDPQILIKQLTIPVLILQGSNDIQISVEDAKLLSEASPTSKLLIINSMNHILRIVEGNDRQANIATYSQESLPIAEELVKNIADFILK